MGTAVLLSALPSLMQGGPGGCRGWRLMLPVAMVKHSAPDDCSFSLLSVSIEQAVGHPSCSFAWQFLMAAPSPSMSNIQYPGLLLASAAPLRGGLSPISDVLCAPRLF